MAFQDDTSGRFQKCFIVSELQKTLPRSDGRDPGNSLIASRFQKRKRLRDGVLTLADSSGIFAKNTAALTTLPQLEISVNIHFGERVRTIKSRPRLARSELRGMVVPVYRQGILRGSYTTPPYRSPSRALCCGRDFAA